MASAVSHRSQFRSPLCSMQRDGPISLPLSLSMECRFSRRVKMDVSRREKGELEKKEIRARSAGWGT